MKWLISVLIVLLSINAIVCYKQNFLKVKTAKYVINYNEIILADVIDEKTLEQWRNDPNYWDNVQDISKNKQQIKNKQNLEELMDFLYQDARSDDDLMYIREYLKYLSDGEL